MNNKTSNTVNRIARIRLTVRTVRRRFRSASDAVFFNRILLTRNTIHAITARIGVQIQKDDTNF